MQITLTPAQLTRAQMGAHVPLNTGETLVAVDLDDGWKYILLVDGIVASVHYAAHGLEAALAALNEEGAE